MSTTDCEYNSLRNLDFKSNFFKLHQAQLN